MGGLLGSQLAGRIVFFFGKSSEQEVAMQGARILTRLVN